MGKFNAATAVERMEYDFTEYGGKAGMIPEPSTGAISAFFAEVKAVMKDTKAARELLARKDDTDLTEEETTRLLDQVDDVTDLTERMQVRLREAVALLCGATVEGEGDEARVVGGSPSVEELSALPFRVQQAFNTWIMGEIQPKKATPGTKR